MTKKQMQARIAELEAMVLTLTTAINAMRAPIYFGPEQPKPLLNPLPIYVGPAQPVVNPLPINPFPMPYIGDPPYPWGPTSTGLAVGGLQSQCNMGHQEG